MYIVIVGCGRIGFNLTRAMLTLGHEVTAVENSVTRYELVGSELGSAILLGDGSSIETLKEAGVERAELVVAVTDADEVNLAVCQLAKHVFRTPRTMAMVRNPAHDALFRLLGIDSVINSTHLLISNMEEEVGEYSIVHLLNLRRHSMDLVTLSIPSDASVVCRPLKEIVLPPNSFFVLIVKDEGPVLPQENIVLSGGDEVVVVTVPDEEQALHEALTAVGE